MEVECGAEFVENPQGTAEFYADEVGYVEVIGDRIRIVFIQYRKAPGADRIVKMPVLEVIRPIEGFGRAAMMVRAAVISAKGETRAGQAH